MVFFPSWTLDMCVFRLLFWLKLWLQKVHSNGFFPSWTAAICCSKLLFDFKQTLQIEHFNFGCDILSLCSVFKNELGIVLSTWLFWNSPKLALEIGMGSLSYCATAPLALSYNTKIYSLCELNARDSSQVFIILHIDNKQRIMYKMLLGIAGVGSEIVALGKCWGIFFCDSLTAATMRTYQNF